MLLEPVLNNHAASSARVDLYLKRILRLNLNIPHSWDVPLSLLIYINVGRCNEWVRLLPPLQLNVHADKRRAQSVKLKKPFVAAQHLVPTKYVSAICNVLVQCPVPAGSAECPAPAVPVTFNYGWAPCFNVLHSGSVFMCVFQLSPWQSKYPQVAILIPVGTVRVCMWVSPHSAWLIIKKGGKKNSFRHWLALSSGE